jgi:hypothetical protein
MGFRVFISYSTRDITLAAHVKQLLEAVGAQVFVAAYSLPAGAELAREIIAAIKTCDLFVLLWGHNAKTSEWVPQEIGVAKGHNKPVIPVVLQPGADLPGFLKGLKYLPLYKDPRKALVWLQRSVAGKVAERSKVEGITWLGIMGVLLWLVSQDKRKG